MFCPRCGTGLHPGAAVCITCGTRVAATILSPPAMTRPTAVTVLAVLQFIGGALWGLAGALVAFANIAAPPAQHAEPGSTMVATVLMAMAAYQIICGIGLWNLRSYGRIMQMVSAGIGLLGIPIGTIISIVILVYLSKPGVKVLFSDKRADELTPQEM